AVLLEEAGHHRKILFSLGEKIRRAHNEKSKEYFSVVVRAERATAGLASFVGIRLIKSSDFVQEGQHYSCQEKAFAQTDFNWTPYLTPLR
ncbi:MAG: hypothetical protein HY538_03650, partial [Deltaproteobacteria bacterium]|nr:hypothetical protein [Deltaproteobacteria bacterium]